MPEYVEVPPERLAAEVLQALFEEYVSRDGTDYGETELALQDKVARNIVNAMSLTLTPEEIEELESPGTSNVEAHDAYLQGLSLYLRKTPEDNAKSEEHFLRAIKLDPEFKRAHAALAQVYLQSAEKEYSRAIGIYWQRALYFSKQHLARTEGAKISGAHVARARLALFKYQVDVALDEATLALTLNKNDAEALKTKALALIYSSKHAQGRDLANQSIRLDPTVIDEPFFIIGLSYFAEKNYSKAVEFLERAIQVDPKDNTYPLLLAASYANLGLVKEAKEAFDYFRKLLRDKFWIARGVHLFPFEDGEVLERLADGFEAAGAVSRPPARYLRLDREHRLSGAEMKSLVFGRVVEGIDFWGGNAWKQTRSKVGEVSHTGVSLHTNFRDAEENGTSWIENDLLCERWALPEGEIMTCVRVYRSTNDDEYGYYMATESGPHPFRISN